MSYMFYSKMSIYCNKIQYSNIYSIAQIGSQNVYFKIIMARKQIFLLSCVCEQHIKKIQHKEYLDSWTNDSYEWILSK